MKLRNRKPGTEKLHRVEGNQRLHKMHAIASKWCKIRLPIAQQEKKRKNTHLRSKSGPFPSPLPLNIWILL